MTELRGHMPLVALVKRQASDAVPLPVVGICSRQVGKETEPSLPIVPFMMFALLASASPPLPLTTREAFMPFCVIPALTLFSAVAPAGT
jgi:hypothetical protein